MLNIRKFDFEQFQKKTPKRNLRQAAQAYINTAIKLYIKIEANVSILDPEGFGDSANIVCSLNRAIEHLLKLRLFTIDPLLLYPLPKKLELEDYCRIKKIPTKIVKDTERRIEEREILAHTITFKEALSRVDLTQTDTDFDFKVFKKIYALRNSLEHHWDRNEELLQNVVGMMSTKIIPSIKSFISELLKEDPKDYLNYKLLEEVERLDRAKQQGHSLKLQHRLEEHINLYKKDPQACLIKYSLPELYKGLAEEDTEAECPVCNNYFTAFWDWEADYDDTPGPVGAFPDSKCLFCHNCNFYIDGIDIGNYLPDGLEIQFEPEFDEEY
jgi:hypothetical protein